MERLKEMMDRVREQLVAYAKARKTIEELNSLTDAELRDIGITRSMIRGIAYEEQTR